MKKILTGMFLFLYAGFSLAAINLNTATQSDLESIKGIGPKKAQAIIEYRTKNGNFKKVDDLQNIKGIGHGKSFDKIKGEFTVDASTNPVSPAGPAMKASGPAMKANGPAMKAAPKGFEKPVSTIPQPMTTR